MRVKSVRVIGLFDVFDHEVPLQISERVTIIHGPNGFGKTVMLRMIVSLIDGKREIFEHVPFREFVLTFEDNSARIIRRSVDEDEHGRSQSVRLEFIHRDSNGTESIATPSQTPEIPKDVLRMVDQRVPVPYRLSGAGWTDGSGGQFSLKDILDLFPEAEEVLPTKYRPGRFFDISPSLEVFFVETNRLAAEAPPRRRPGALGAPDLSAYGGGDGLERGPRVKHYSDDIIRRIRNVLTEYASNSQDKDRTFPERLVRFIRDGRKSLKESAIISSMAEFERKRRRLVSLGLLDKESGLTDLTEDEVRRVNEALTIYVGDTTAKLEVFDDISRRIGALVDIVNSRFKYKHLALLRNHGFVVFSDSKKFIAIEDLSSGEQNELVLLYELLFRVPKDGLVLVDEPEISLHVAWQSRFLPDLIQILGLIDAHAIVATHSPVIIGTRSDLTVELTGPDTVAQGADSAATH
jgi:predicted ATP-binding protein involved in virulence